MVREQPASWNRHRVGEVGAVDLLRKRLDRFQPQQEDRTDERHEEQPRRG